MKLAGARYGHRLFFHLASELDLKNILRVPPPNDLKHRCNNRMTG